MAVPRRRPNRTLTGLRAALGMTQEAYAHAVGVSEREVRDWEAGRVRCPQTFALHRLHALHGTTEAEDLGFVSRRPAPPLGTVRTSDPETTEAAVYRRNLLGLVLTAAFSAQHLPPISKLLAQDDPYQRQVGRPDIDRIVRANSDLTSADLTVGGAAVAPDVLMRLFRSKAALLHGRYASEASRQAAHSAVAHLGSTIGWMLYDSGRHLASRQLYVASLRVAGSADDVWPLRAVICSEMARQALHCGGPAEAGELIGIAHSADSHLPAAARAELHAISATIAAITGDRSRTLDHIARAETEFADARPHNDPTWIAWFTAAELSGDTGDAVAALAQHHDDLRDDAAARLTAAATDHSPNSQRSAALAWTQLAQLHAARSSSPLAAHAAHQAVDLAERLRSPRLTETLTAATNTLSTLDTHPDLDAALTRIRALQPAV
ncbi:helix-turn-helix domain-containing protein [Micromonospora aurantiaca (nom. illeg.)]|uniref:helix-turn-helix domain-containing protein n=1 Tax=Micromonospora aurantiaca (nom. illeg.) TaxID=47850 RepID=UPI0033F48ABE